MSNLYLRKEHPLRPVNWRWLRAQFLRQTTATGGRRRPGRSRGDSDITQTMHYMDRRQAAGSDPDLRDALVDEFRDLAIAVDIYEADDRRMRYMLEAWLLAHMPSVEAVARKSHKAAGVVRWYESLFFNVLDRMDDGDWVMSRVLAPAVFDGLGQRDYETIWKLVAYVGGEWVLEPFLRMAHYPVRPTGPDGAEPFIRSQPDKTQYRNRLVNTWGMRFPDAHTRLEFEEVCLRMDEVRAAAGSIGGAALDFVAHVESMMKAIPFGVGSEGRAPTDAGVRPVGTLGAEVGGWELRAFESVYVRAGLALPPLDGLAAPAFPEPRTAVMVGALTNEPASATEGGE